MSLPIDGSCDSELSVKGLLPEELLIGDWTKEPEPIAEVSTETEIDEEADENQDVFFIELEGSILQVGNRKKRKKKSSSALHVVKRQQVTCSMCHQRGHNKSNKICPNWIEKGLFTYRLSITLSANSLGKVPSVETIKSPV